MDDLNACMHFAIGVIMPPILISVTTACAKRSSAAARELHQRHRPGGPTSPALHPLSFSWISFLQYLWYFPAQGSFTHYPIHVASNEQLVAFAQPACLQVVSRPSTVDTRSWEYVSQQASLDELLSFLDKENLAAVCIYLLFLSYVGLCV
jgi:hypothetical protein